MNSNLRIYSRSYLSISHLSAAALFAHKATKIEQQFKFGGDGECRVSREHGAYVASSVMLSAAFLEATINELFSDCAERSITRLNPLSATRLMTTMWNRGIPRTARYSIIEKYDIALELNEKPPFVQGTNPYQDTKLLIELRNALIHYEPETVLTTATPYLNSSDIHKFEKRFKGKFALNPLTGAGNAFYPDKLLGSGCAMWAVNTSVAFADEFFSLLGVNATYEHVREAYLNGL